MNVFKSIIIAIVFMAGTLSMSQKAFAHCEIPCGIYEDTLRIELIAEHITTIEKSMSQIKALSVEGEKNYNQLVRWVMNKEEHAIKIQEIVSQYFLHQRIKIADPSDVEAWAKYTNQLSLLHQLLVLSMKAKQGVDADLIAKMQGVLDKFAHSYFHTHTH